MEEYNFLRYDKTYFVRRGKKEIHDANSFLFVFFLQLALPQLVAGAQFPFNFATGATAPHGMAGFYYPQPMAAAQAAAAQTNYLQGLQGYTFNNFGASFPQGYIRYKLEN